MRYILGDFDFANEKLEVLRKIFIKKAILWSKNGIERMR